VTARGLQRAAGGLLATIVVLLLANSAFLATASASELVAWMVRAHVGLGLGLLVVLPVFVAVHVRLHTGHRNERAMRVGRFVAGLGGLGAVAGLALWGLGKQSALRWLVLLHEAAFVAAVVAYLVHRLRAVVTPALGAERGAAGAAVLLVAATWALQLGDEGEPPAQEEALVSGLSQATTTGGHVLTPSDLNDVDYCIQCHTGIAERWEQSAHRFSSLNDPFYAANLADAQTRRSPDELAFCAGCHDPVLLLTGRAREHLQPDQPDAEAGITCLVCHNVVETTRFGNASYVLQAPDHYPFYGSDDPDEQEQNRALIRSKPDKHRASFMPPHLRSTELCMSCHKAHLDPELNRHRWIGGQNDFDPWHDSVAGGKSARTFGPPRQPQQRCQECHMPRIAADDPGAKNGTIADHAFPGANTALPAVLGMDEWAERNAEFLEGVLVADVAAVRTDQGEALAPAGELTVPRRSTVTAEIVVTNLDSGHRFPGGVADLREAWLEVVLVDEEGTTLAASGLVGDDGHLDASAFRWNTVLLDAEGNHLRRHEVEQTHVVLTSRRIFLGTSDVVPVAFEMPTRPARLVARVMHRKFPRDFVTFALGADAPAMPVHVLATAELALTPGDWDPDPPGPDAGPRLRRLGIAHLLHGDTVSARDAAEAAAVRLPDSPLPQHDLARIALRDGNLAAAEAAVRAADALAPGHPTGGWLLGRIRAGQGRHEDAIGAFGVAIEAFPEDRVVLALRAESLFELERDEEAAADLERVLAIDPEHLAAHALLARIRASQGDVEAAAAHEAAWNRYRPSSQDREATEAARRRSPTLDARAREQWTVILAPPNPGQLPADLWAQGARD